MLQKIKNRNEGFRPRKTLLCLYLITTTINNEWKGQGLMFTGQKNRNLYFPQIQVEIIGGFNDAQSRDNTASSSPLSGLPENVTKDHEGK